MIVHRSGGMVPPGGGVAFNHISDLFLVRHGETEWNRVPRIQGSSDSPLTALGIAQARAAGRLLRAHIRGRSAALIASPLGRARRTAEIIAAELGIGFGWILVEPRLREVSWGIWDGRSRAEIEAIEPGGWHKLQRDWSFAPPGGERYAEARIRLREWLLSHSGGPAIAVTHGMASAIIRGLLLDLSGDDSLALERPQDALFRLHRGRVERLCYAIPSSTARS